MHRLLSTHSAEGVSNWCPDYFCRLRPAVVCIVLLLGGNGPALSGSLGDINPVTSYCPERYLQFWDTIVFTLAVDRLQNSKGQPALQGGNEYDIKVLRGTDTVGNIRQLVADRLNQFGFQDEDGSVQASHVGQLVHVQSVVTCAIPQNLRMPSAR